MLFPSPKILVNCSNRASWQGSWEKGPWDSFWWLVRTHWLPGSHWFGEWWRRRVSQVSGLCSSQGREAESGERDQLRTSCFPPGSLSRTEPLLGGEDKQWSDWLHQRRWGSGIISHQRLVAETNPGTASVTRPVSSGNGETALSGNEQKWVGFGTQEE